jgi:hypothetical protein
MIYIKIKKKLKKLLKENIPISPLLCSGRYGHVRIPREVDPGIGVVLYSQESAETTSQRKYH